MNLKEGSERLVINAKGFLKLPNLDMLIKQKYHFPETWLSQFWWIANSVLDKSKSTLPSLFNSPDVLSSGSDKAELFAKNFSKNSNLDESGISDISFIHTSWTLQYVSEGALFSRLLEDLIKGHCILRMLDKGLQYS